MTVFKIEGNITASTETELLGDMDWLATNYGTKIGEAQAFGESLSLRFAITENTYNDASTTLNALKTQFTTRLGTNWNMLVVQG